MDGDRHAPTLGLERETPDHPVEQGPERHGGGCGGAPLLGIEPRERQELPSQDREALDLVETRMQGVFILRGVPMASQRHLELRSETRERGLELVGGVGCEAPLDLEAFLDATEHLVESVDQTPDLVLLGRARKPSTVSNTVSPSWSRVSSPGFVGSRALPRVMLRAIT